MVEKHEQGDEFVERYTQRQLAFRALRKIRRIVDAIEDEDQRNRKWLIRFGVFVLITILVVSVYFMAR